MNVYSQQMRARLVALVLALALVGLVLLAPGLSSGATPAFKVLIVKNNPAQEQFHAASVAAGIETITELGQAHGFAVDATFDPASFTAANLAQYRAVIFLSPEAQIFTSAQQTAFQNYIAAGGGYVGVHGAIYMHRTGWSWYRQLVGANPLGGQPPQPANLVDVFVVDGSHPSTAHLDNPWRRKDEWYNFAEPLVSNVNVLLKVDENDYSGGTMGDPHPIAWYHSFGGGRAWYTGGGHYAENFADPDFKQHLLGGILWAADRVPPPTPTATTPPTATPPRTATPTTPTATPSDFLPLVQK